MSPQRPQSGSFLNLTTQEAADIGIKLRESCDSCLTAKVKCEKGRPYCQRCLTNGNDCQYSPSARAGRKQRNSGISKPPQRKRPSSIEIPSTVSGLSGPISSPWTPQLFQQRQDRSTIDIANNTTGNQRNPFMSHTPPLSTDDQKADALGADNKDGIAHIGKDSEFSHQYPSPPFNDPFADLPPHCNEPYSASSVATFPDLASTVPSPSIAMHQTIDPDTWTADDSAYDMPLLFGSGPLDIMSHEPTMSVQSSFGQNLLEKSSFDEMVQGNGGLENISHQTDGCTSGSQECDDCFATCLSALHALHAHSWKTPAAAFGLLPFDVILTINRTAVKGCQAMMHCTSCSSKNSGPVSTMLLGTVFGKVVSLYRAAVNNRQKPSNDAQLAFGSYTVLDEDRYCLETEILLFELNRVQRTLGQFHVKCRESDADKDSVGVYEPQAKYLAQELQVIVDFLQDQKTKRLHNH